MDGRVSLHRLSTASLWKVSSCKVGCHGLAPQRWGVHPWPQPGLGAVCERCLDCQLIGSPPAYSLEAVNRGWLITWAILDSALSAVRERTWTAVCIFQVPIEHCGLTGRLHGCAAARQLLLLTTVFCAATVHKQGDGRCVGTWSCLSVCQSCLSASCVSLFPRRCFQQQHCFPCSLMLCLAVCGVCVVGPLTCCYVHTQRAVFDRRVHSSSTCGRTLCCVLVERPAVSSSPSNRRCIVFMRMPGCWHGLLMPSVGVLFAGLQCVSYRRTNACQLTVLVYLQCFRPAGRL